MFNTEDILARLRKGENAETIVKEFTDAMNAASASHDAEAKAKAKEAELKAAKTAAARKLVDGFNSYILTYHPNSMIVKEFDLDSVFSDEDCLEFAETIDEYIKMFDNMQSFFGNIKIEPVKVNDKPATKMIIKHDAAPKEIDSVFSDFFKRMNI